MGLPRRMFKGLEEWFEMETKPLSMVSPGFSIPHQFGNPLGHRHIDGSKRIERHSGSMGLPSPTVVRPITVKEHNLVARDVS